MTACDGFRNIINNNGLEFRVTAADQWQNGRIFGYIRKHIEEIVFGTKHDAGAYYNGLWHMVSCRHFSCCFGARIGGW